jgi:DNA-binding HxlR family transcriptional regulator
VADPDGDTPAPLETALERVGDRWSLLVVDALLTGALRFGELSERVQGVSPNVLSKRLRDLEEAGVVVAEPYSTRPPRNRYRLSALGHDLAPSLAALAVWGERAAREQPSGRPAPGAGSDDQVGGQGGDDLGGDLGGDLGEDVHYA